MVLADVVIFGIAEKVNRLFYFVKYECDKNMKDKGVLNRLL